MPKRPRSFARLSFVLTAVATSAVVPATAGAQVTSQREQPMPADRNAMPGAYIVLDSATVRASAARTLADLLAGRVLGLAVTYPSGAQGYAPQVRVRGAAGTVGAAEPLLYVDGMLVPDDSYWLGPQRDGHRLSFAWDLPVSEIESVTIVRGQSAGALMEFGAARGAVLVRTRRPERGSARIAGFVDVSSSTDATDFPANFATDGTTGSGPTDACTLSDQALGNCVATGTRSWNPLEQASPFRAASGTRGGVSSVGGVGRGSYRAAASFGRTDGVMAPAVNERLELALSYANAPASRVALAFDARHGRADQAVFDWEEGVLAAGLRGNASDDATRGYADDPDGFLALSDPVEARRTSVGGRARWALRPSWEAEARFGIDRYSRNSALSAMGPGSDSKSSQSSWSAEGGVKGEHRIGRARGSVHARLFASKTTYEDSTAGGLSSTTFLRTPVSSFGVAVSERVRFGASGQRSIGGGLRLSNLSLFDEGIGRGTAHQVDAAWDIGSESFFPRTRLLRGLRFHVAHGSATDIAPVLGVLGTTFAGFPSSIDPGAAPPLVRETEFGANASVMDGALTFELRRFTRVASDAVLRAPVPAMVGYAWAYNGGHTFETKGEELRIALERRRFGLFSLDAALSVATARDRVTELATPEFLALPPEALAAVIVRQGGPIGNLGTNEMSWDDLNGDGIIDQSEVTVVPGLVTRGPTRPTRFIAFTTGLGFGPFSAGAVVDAQGGHKRYDTLFEWRCGVSANCQELYDPSTSLQDQARAIAARTTVGLVGGAQDGDFVRLREVWLRYTLPGALVPGWLGDARLTLAGHQLATWTSYEGLDPEVGVPIGSSILATKPFSQPIIPTWSLRLELGR